MPEAPVKKIIEAALENLVSQGTRGVYPFAFTGKVSPQEEYGIDAPIVNNQLVFSPSTQILSFLVMDVPSLLATAQKLFPEMEKSEGLKMVISANNEIINSATSKLSLILARIEGKSEATITPPLVTNMAGENRLSLPSEDSLAWNFCCEQISFDFIVSVQDV